MLCRIVSRNSSTLSSSSTSPTAAAVTASGLYGTLWSRGHETLGVDSRRIVHVHGKGSATFLQGLVTADLLTYSLSGITSSSNSATPPPLIIPPRCEILTSSNNATDGEDDYYSRTSHSYHPSFSLLRPACMLDARGRILTDLLIWNISPEELFLDIPANSISDVLSHLHQYKVGRSTKSVTIQEANDYSSIHVLYGTLHDRNLPPGFLGQLDPRHPSLGLRLLQRSDNTSSAVTQEERHNHLASRIDTNLFPESKGTYNFLRRLAGIAEGKEELMGKTPLESNQDFLQSISFHKGCYLGQELTARSNYTGIIRKRLFPCIFVDTSTQLPIPFWTSPRRKKEQQQEQEQSPIPFPRLGIADAAAIISVLQGIPIQGSAQSGNDGTTDENNFNSNAQTHVTEEVKEKALPSEGDINDCTNTKVMETLDELETHGKIGSKIINRSDGRTVGEIVSAALPGTSVVIAQMRLEWLGMLKNSTGGENDQDATRNTVHHPWKITNKVVIGSGKRELRCLPYIPLWWPNINMSTGKGEEQEKD